MKPCADLKDEFIHQLNSYVMSNISPQHCRFNRGVWLSLEHLTRVWAQRYGEIHISSGVIFDRDGTLGRDADADAKRMRSNNGKIRVAVPSHFYKVFVRREDDQHHVIAFLLNHNNQSNGIGWDTVRPVAEAVVSSTVAIERAASLVLHPNLKRSALSEDTRLRVRPRASQPGTQLPMTDESAAQRRSNLSVSIPPILNVGGPAGTHGRL